MTVRSVRPEEMRTESMADMKQFMVLITELNLARLDALRIVMGVSRAEVARQALEGRGIRALERAQESRLERLITIAIAAGHGSSWEGFVIDLVKRPAYRQSAPTLEELEAIYAVPGDANSVLAKVDTQA